AAAGGDGVQARGGRRSRVAAGECEAAGEAERRRASTRRPADGERSSLGCRVVATDVPDGVPNLAGLDADHLPLDVGDERGVRVAAPRRRK
ncbi:Os09g0524500, partial [Oryza sativa Japonica Group]